MLEDLQLLSLKVDVVSDYDLLALYSISDTIEVMILANLSRILRGILAQMVRSYL